MSPLKVGAAGGQGYGDDRKPGRDERAVRGTSGVRGGLSGSERGAVIGGWSLALAIAGAVCILNFLTRFHDAPGEGLLLPVVLEVTSFLSTAVVFAIPAALAIWLRRRRPPPWRAASVLTVAAVCYCAVHVAGFSALRWLAFPVFIDAAYRIGPPLRDLPYEFLKDALSYAVVLATFWRLLGWTVQMEGQARKALDVFDIRDGARLVRAPLDEILAIRSAGNYVEFWLGDGRRPLMRSPLNAIESQLGPQGFVRTHRSWLVNAARVTGLRPEGSGDYAVELGAVEVPLSRRFPAGLAALRG